MRQWIISQTSFYVWIKCQNTRFDGSFNLYTELYAIRHWLSETEKFHICTFCRLIFSNFLHSIYKSKVKKMPPATARNILRLQNIRVIFSLYHFPPQIIARTVDNEIRNILVAKRVVGVLDLDFRKCFKK